MENLGLQKTFVHVDGALGGLVLPFIDHIMNGTMQMIENEVDLRFVLDIQRRLEKSFCSRILLDQKFVTSMIWVGCKIKLKQTSCNFSGGS